MSDLNFPVQGPKTLTENLTPAEMLATECTLNLIDTAKTVQAKIDAVFRQHGMARTEAKALNMLREAGAALPPYVISERLAITRGAVTQLLDGLAERGLINRTNHPHDRRMLLVEITEAGRTVLQQCRPDLLNQQIEVVARLEPGEQELLVELLSRIQAQLLAVSDN